MILRVLIGVIAISFRDGEFGFPAVMGSAIVIAVGPIVYRLARKGGCEIPGSTGC